MRLEDYPPQEPTPDFARAYADEVMKLGADISPDEYAYGDDPYQSIAIQLPDKPNGSILAMVHGGGWTTGYKEFLNFIGPAFTAAGVIFASVGYRLAPQNIFPTGADDVADALAWLYHHAEELGGDPSRIFAGGHSAGGHYTALLGVGTGWQAVREVPADVIRGCLPVSGVYQFGDGSGLSIRPRFLGEDDSLERPASPLFNIDATPPFFMAYGENDFAHLITQAGVMKNALSDKGGDASELTVAGCDHLQTCVSLADADGTWAPAALAWMAAH